MEANVDDAEMGSGPSRKEPGGAPVDAKLGDEGPMLIHVWEVDPAREGAAVQHLDKMLSAAAADPGFVHARVLGSIDRTSIAALIEMRTVEDRQRLEQLPEVRETLRHLDGTVNLIIRLYHQLNEYGR
jgi:hypothetical protein